MTNVNRIEFHRRAGAGSEGRNLGEKLGQEFGPVIENAFDMVVKDEIKCVETRYREQNKMYDFDANFEDIEQNAKEVVCDRFRSLLRVLANKPEYIYEIESLFAKLAEEETEAYYERMCPEAGFGVKDDGHMSWRKYVK